MVMNDNILKKVEEYEYKRGITYAKPDGKLYKTTKFIYVLVFIYTLAMNWFFILGVSMSDTLLQAMKTPLYSVLGFMAGLIVALILSNFKRNIVTVISSIAVNALSSLGLVLTFAPLLEGVAGGFKGAFYWRHLIPLCLLLLVNLWVNVIALRANLKTRKTYKKIVDNAYAMHHTSIEDGSLDEEKWEEVLRNL